MKLRWMESKVVRVTSSTSNKAHGQGLKEE